MPFLMIFRTPPSENPRWIRTGRLSEPLCAWIHTYIHTVTIHTYIHMLQRCSFGSTWHSNWHWVRRCCSKMLLIMEIISTNLVRAKYSKPTAYIHTSENTEEITIDQWKGNKKPDACFPMCCAHARGVSRMFFSPERIRDCTTHCIKRCFHSQPWPVLSIADEFQ